MASPAGQTSQRGLWLRGSVHEEAHLCALTFFAKLLSRNCSELLATRCASKTFCPSVLLLCFLINVYTQTLVSQSAERRPSEIYQRLAPRLNSLPEILQRVEKSQIWPQFSTLFSFLSHPRFEMEQRIINLK